MATGTIELRIAALAKANTLAVATATVDEPATIGTASDIVQRAAIDNATMYVGLQQIGEVLTQQQDMITQLQASALMQSEHSARMEASLKTLSCPDNVQDPNFKERHVIAIGDCLDSKLCTCDLRIILETPAPAPPPLDKPPIELVPNPPTEPPQVTVPSPPELATPVS